MSKQTMVAAQFLEFRKRNMWSEKEMAEIIGVTWQAIRHWETGARRIPETTVRLIQLFEKYPQLVKEF